MRKPNLRKDSDEVVTRAQGYEVLQTSVRKKEDLSVFDAIFFLCHHVVVAYSNESDVE